MRRSLAQAFLLNLLVWAAIYFFWLFVTRTYHPTRLISLLATAVLVLISAAAVYLNSLLLLPKYAGPHLYGRYILFLVASVLLLALFGVLIIGLIYDQLWGPDPLRFGFWTNLAYETIFISLHLCVAMCVIRFIRLTRQFRGQRSVRRSL